ncbi:MAG: enoyl-CoA hydratase-related protein [Actinomycetota bacterium]
MTVSIERRGGVTVITLNRPEVRNCIDAPTAVALAEGVTAFAADAAARVLVVTGAGPTAFCTGADLSSASQLLDHAWTDRAGPIGFARLDPGKPTIAAVNGCCFAGGMELAAWCDFRIASQNAEFGALNRRWGVPFIDGGTQRFPRIVGQANALYLIETGVRFDAAQALRMGFVQEVVADGAALERAVELAARIADYPQASLRADRAATIAAFHPVLDEGIAQEAVAGRATLLDPEMLAGLERFVSGDRPEPPRAR